MMIGIGKNCRRFDTIQTTIEGLSDSLPDYPA